MSPGEERRRVRIAERHTGWSLLRFHCRCLTLPVWPVVRRRPANARTGWRLRSADGSADGSLRGRSDTPAGVSWHDSPLSGSRGKRRLSVGLVWEAANHPFGTPKSQHACFPVREGEPTGCMGRHQTRVPVGGDVKSVRTRLKVAPDGRLTVLLRSKELGHRRSSSSNMAGIPYTHYE